MESSPAGKKRILVVEDDGVLSKGLEILLNNNGYSSKTARKNECLSAFLSRSTFDLILFGCENPGEDLPLITSLRKECSMPPFIMMNTLPEHKPAENGASAFMEKPLEPLRLLEKIGEVLSRVSDHPTRCCCGNLLGIRRSTYFEIRCRRCKKTVRIFYK